MSIEDDRLLREFERKRDETAFRALYRSHTPTLYAFALRLCRGARSDAEELVQDTWVRAVEHLGRFERRSSFRTWLCGILVNCHREVERKRARAPFPLDETYEPRAASVERFPRLRSSAEPMDVERAIARLPDGYREVLVLHDVNGYTHREVADLLGIEEGTSKSQLARGRARLRELLLGAMAEEPRRNERG